MSKIKVKTIFISDTHLGNLYCKDFQLLDFLKKYQTENLYLVGDIIDGWKMNQKIYWNDNYSFIIRKILGMIKDGTNVVYIAGNHDEFLRNFLPNQFGHVSLLNEAVYTNINGEKLLIIHGDIFDFYTIKYKWLYYFGDKAYSFSLWLNTVNNWIRKKLGLKHWSLSQMLKKNVKSATNFINSFEECMIEYTKSKGCDGIVCGHIHTPIIKSIKEIKYYNCGDWIESCTAIIENLDGTIELIHSN